MPAGQTHHAGHAPHPNRGVPGAGGGSGGGVAIHGVTLNVTGNIFACRMNEIFLMSQNRPLRSVQREGGWTPQTIAEHALPAMKASLYPLDRSQDIFSWDPL